MQSDDGSSRSATEYDPETGLSARDQAILAFERVWLRHVAGKEEAIRLDFGVSSARYYQLVDELIRRPEALRADPLLVGRLLRLRESRVARRAARSDMRRSAAR